MTSKIKPGQLWITQYVDFGTKRNYTIIIGVTSAKNTILKKILFYQIDLNTNEFIIDYDYSGLTGLEFNNIKLL